MALWATMNYEVQSYVWDQIRQTNILTTDTVCSKNENDKAENELSEGREMRNEGSDQYHQMLGDGISVNERVVSLNRISEDQPGQIAYTHL